MIMALAMTLLLKLQPYLGKHLSVKYYMKEQESNYSVIHGCFQMCWNALISDAV